MQHSAIAREHTQQSTSCADHLRIAGICDHDIMGQRTAALHRLKKLRWIIDKNVRAAHQEPRSKSKQRVMKSSPTAEVTRCGRQQQHFATGPVRQGGQYVSSTYICQCALIAAFERSYIKSVLSSAIMLKRDISITNTPSYLQFRIRQSKVQSSWAVSPVRSNVCSVRYTPQHKDTFWR